MVVSDLRYPVWSEDFLYIMKEFKTINKETKKVVCQNCGNTWELE